MAEPEDPVLFCPFCKDCFEGERVCPDHELALVPFEALPKAPRQRPRDDDELALHDLRFGRGLLVGAFVSVMIGFMLPMVTTTIDDTSTASGFMVASRVAPNLWAVPLVAVAFLSILFRRRTPRKMRGVRLAIPVLGVIGATSLSFTLYRIRQGAELLSERYGGDVSVELDAGVWVMALGLGLAIVAGLRFGVTPAQRYLPHGAGPEGDSEIVVDDSGEED